LGLTSVELVAVIAILVILTVASVAASAGAQPLLTHTDVFVSGQNGYQLIAFTRLNREWLEQGSQHLIISRGEAVGSYQAFPDLCRLTNGDLLCVFYAGYSHDSLPRNDWPRGGRICRVRSRDEGRTWSAPPELWGMRQLQTHGLERREVIRDGR